MGVADARGPRATKNHHNPKATAASPRKRVVTQVVDVSWV
jgi:hypothetical protein